MSFLCKADLSIVVSPIVPKKKLAARFQQARSAIDDALMHFWVNGGKAEEYQYIVAPISPEG